MRKTITRIASGRWKHWIIPLIAIISLLTCMQQINVQNFNNINIFRYSSFHLIAHQPLYIEYPASYFDFFLYYPAFPVLFLPFAYLPPAIALITWTLASVLLFIRSVHLLPVITDTAKKLILLLTLPELINNQQYVQTNIFLTSLLLLAFIYFERSQLFWAAFFTALAFCIKGYGGIIGLLFMFYPGRGKFMGYALFWGLLITALPLLFVTFPETVTCYRQWLKMISSDEIKEGMSVIGKWGNTHERELVITLGAFVLLLFSFAATALTAARRLYAIRALMCCYLLVWVVLFNRAAESPTYLLAATGMAGWFAVDGFSAKNKLIAAFVIIASYLLQSDIIPPLIHHFFRRHHMKPYAFMLFFLYLQTLLFYRTFKVHANQPSSSTTL